MVYFFNNTWFLCASGYSSGSSHSVLCRIAEGREIIHTIKKERNIKIHLSFMCAVILCGFYFHITKIEWMICLILFALVLSLELVNTAIEAVVDLASPDIHPLAKLSKDAAAGAVLISAIISAIIGLMIFIPYII